MARFKVFSLAGFSIVAVLFIINLSFVAPQDPTTEDPPETPDPSATTPETTPTTPETTATTPETTATTPETTATTPETTAKTPETTPTTPETTAKTSETTPTTPETTATTPETTAKTPETTATTPEITTPTTQTSTESTETTTTSAPSTPTPRPIPEDGTNILDYLERNQYVRYAFQLPQNGLILTLDISEGDTTNYYSYKNPDPDDKDIKLEPNVPTLIPYSKEGSIFQDSIPRVYVGIKGVKKYNEFTLNVRHGRGEETTTTSSTVSIYISCSSLMLPIIFSVKNLYS